MDSVRVTAMLDSGAVSNFIDVSVWKQLGKPITCTGDDTITAVNGQLLASKTTEASLSLHFDLSERPVLEPFSVAPLVGVQAILGLPFYVRWKPIIDYERKKLLSVTHPMPSISLITAQEFMTTEGVCVGLLSAAPGSLPEVALPWQYSAFSETFSKSKATALPPSRDTDHTIDLEKDTRPPFGPIYNLSELELAALRAYLDEGLANGTIRPSKSPAGAPILFVKKKDGSLRLCVDYRGLNKITIKNRYPLPLISELLDRVKRAKIFTKLDLRNAYGLIRIKTGDEWKTAFRTRYGHFEYLVMPFGLTNAPATFQAYVNDVLREYLDEFCIAYLDDILIFSDDPAKHEEHVKKVLQKLKDAGLFCNLDKCLFHTTEIDFLGYVISTDGVHMETSRVESISQWPEPASVKDVQVFLGFANYYRRFVARYSHVARGLTALLKKTTSHFVFGEEARASFRQLKDAFTSAPFLRHFDPALRMVLQTDASDFAISGIVSQPFEGRLHPVAFFSRKMIPAELNYDTGDKEMLAIVESLKHWRHYFEGSRFPILVESDHKNLEAFLTTKTLSRRQARWMLLLSNYDLEIKHLKGTLNPADAPSRRPDFALGAIQTLEEGGELKNSIKELLASDSKGIAILDRLAKGPLSPWTLQDGLLLHDGLIYVPEHPSVRLRLLREHHDSPLAGHYGVKKTLELLTRTYFWPGMRKTVEDYVRTCDTCHRSKTPRHAPHGQLQSLPPPRKPWTDITMDHIVDLPLSGPDKHDAILVVVDRLTKMSHFIPCHKTDSASKLAHYFIRDIVRLHGLPDTIVSDRGTTFRSRFWNTLCQTLKISTNYSTAFHPQSDGQTERVNQTLETYLRSHVNYLQDDWYSFLPLAEFAYNNAESASTKHSPFFANYGIHPRFNALSIRQNSADSVAFNAITHSETIHDIHMTLRQNILDAQATQAKYYDQRHTPKQYSVGDRVWLLTRNIRTQRPSKKLDHRKIGPYFVEAVIGSQAYRLALPPSVRIHNVFHVSLLEPYTENDFPERVAPPPPPVEVEQEEEYEVSQILDSKRVRNSVRYLVQWKGYGPEDNTWEPRAHVAHAPALVADFHARYPDKPH